jgi:hypothetical protein
MEDPWMPIEWILYDKKKVRQFRNGHTVEERTDPTLKRILQYWNNPYTVRWILKCRKGSTLFQRKILQRFIYA